MKKTIVFIGLGIFCSISLLFGQEKLKTDTFTFVFEGKKLSGFIDMPANNEPSSIVVFIPGHVKTHFKNDSYFYQLRSSFVKHGLACVMWDKAGCGNSEGTYDGSQTVESSAKEAITGIEELKRRKTLGFSKIGLWGISRGGLICPLIIKEYPSIAFWISVSGPDGLDSYPYMFESEMRFAGKSEAQIKILLAEKLDASIIFFKGGSYKEYVKAQGNLRKDSFCMSFLELHSITKESYQKEQKLLKGQVKVDRKTKLVIIVPDFKLVLKKVKCPVLAISGEKDFCVNWRNTIPLYKKTIGRHKNRLTIKTFPEGNHGIIKCRTGADNEKMDKYDFCDGYLESMTTWLKENKFGR